MFLSTYLSVCLSVYLSVCLPGSVMAASWCERTGPCHEPSASPGLARGTHELRRAAAKVRLQSCVGT